MSILPGPTPTNDGNALSQAQQNLQKLAAQSGGGVSASGTPGTINNQKQLTTDFNTFLKILTTQLQNQDPTQPLDTNQFTSQLVQYSQLEQSLNTNSKLQALVDTQGGSQISNAVNYIGKTVTATGNSFNLDGSNPTTINYNLSSNAAATVIKVIDANGNTVRQISGGTNAGANQIKFDGSGSGQKPLPAGTYTFQVLPVDNKGNTINNTSFVTGKVTSVDTTGGKITLHIGNITLDSTNVRQVAA